MEPENPSEINRLHAEIDAGSPSREKVIRIGQLLSDQKASLKHGHWLPWLSENVTFDVRTAQRYIRTFENREEVKNDSLSHLTDAKEPTEGEYDTTQSIMKTEPDPIEIASTKPVERSKHPLDLSSAWEPPAVDAVADALAPILSEIATAKELYQRHKCLFEKTESDRSDYEKLTSGINHEIQLIVADLSLSAGEAGRKKRFLVDELEILALRSPAFPPELAQLRDSFREAVISANGSFNGLVAMLQNRVERSAFWRIVGNDVANFRTRLLAREIIKTDSQKHLFRQRQLIDLCAKQHKIPAERLDMWNAHLENVEAAATGLRPLLTEHRALLEKEPPQIPTGDYAPEIISAAEGKRLAGVPTAALVPAYRP